MNIAEYKPGQKFRTRDGQIVTLRGHDSSLGISNVKPDGTASAYCVWTRSGQRHRGHHSNGDLLATVEEPVDATKELEAAQAAYDALGQRLKELQEAQQKAQEPKPWAPPPGDWVIRSFGEGHDVGDETRFWVKRIPAMADEMNASGSVYPSEATAKQVAERLNFFLRLCALASDVNGGTVGGNYSVRFHPEMGRWGVCFSNSGSPYHLFRDCEAVKKAVDIMNRDGWKLPA